MTTMLEVAIALEATLASLLLAILIGRIEGRRWAERICKREEARAARLAGKEGDQ
jgi:hypothetical protein